MNKFNKLLENIENELNPDTGNTLIGIDTFKRTYTLDQCIMYMMLGGRMTYLGNGVLTFQENVSRKIKLTPSEIQKLKAKILYVKNNNIKQDIWVWDSGKESKI